MKNIKIGGKIEASAISLGCMRIASLDEKDVDAIMKRAQNLLVRVPNIKLAKAKTFTKKTQPI